MNWFWKIPFIERYISATEFYSAQLERERIIKLQTDYCDTHHLDPRITCKCYPLIALIKGEK